MKIIKTVNLRIVNFNKIVILLLMTSILIATLISGCINPMKQVPVLRVNITYTERQGIVDADRYSFTQDNVSYIDRPKKIQADSFPAIIGRITMVTTDKNVVIGPWETLPYKGNGNYSFNLGFHDGNFPERGNAIHISIIVVDKSGQRIGYVVEDTKWK